jgi:hypothetical protein
MTNNNQVMLDEVKVENDNKVRSEQLEKLLGNSKVPIVVPAQLPLPRTEPRTSLLGSFNRTFRLSIGAGSKDAPNGHVFSR